MALADRIEIFCNELIKTNSQRKAYREAYPSAKYWKDATVDSKACDFAKKDKVLERLQQMRQAAAEDAKIDRNDLISQLKEIGFAEINTDNVKASEKIKAIEVMARMLGLDSAENDNLSKLDKVLAEIKGNI